MFHRVQVLLTSLSCFPVQVIMKEIKGTKEEDKTPPAWFTSYMEKVAPATSNETLTWNQVQLLF